MGGPAWAHTNARPHGISIPGLIENSLAPPLADGEWPSAWRLGRIPCEPLLAVITERSSPNSVSTTGPRAVGISI